MSIKNSLNPSDWIEGEHYWADDFTRFQLIKINEKTLELKHESGYSLGAISLFFKSGKEVGGKLVITLDESKETIKKEVNIMFDPNKPFKTANGREVKLLTTNGEGPYPIVGYVKFADGIHWGNVTSWMANGLSMCTAKTNLVNDPPVKKIVPLGREDVSTYFIFKHKGLRYQCEHSYMDILNFVCYKNRGYKFSITLEELKKFGWAYSKDGGETWKLCQKEITE